MPQRRRDVDRSDAITVGGSHIVLGERLAGALHHTAPLLRDLAACAQDITSIIEVDTKDRRYKGVVTRARRSDFESGSDSLEIFDQHDRSGRPTSFRVRDVLAVRVVSIDPSRSAEQTVDELQRARRLQPPASTSPLV